MPLTWELSPRAARMARALILATIAAGALYVGNVAFGDGLPPALATLFDSWVFSGLVLSAGTICILRGVKLREDRLAWIVLGAGMVLWALGSIYWSVFLKDLEAAPYPSVADALYLGFYPAAYAALMMFARRRLAGIGASMWLDGLIGVLAVGALGSAFIVPYVAGDTGGSTAVVFTNLAYPAGDLLLIALTVGLFGIMGWRPGRAMVLIGAGLLVLSVADTLYLYRVAHGSFVEGTLLDALWPAGMVLVALAAWQRPPPRVTFNLQGAGVMVAPCLFTLGSLGVLVDGNVRDMNTVSLVLAAATVISVLVRLALTFREVRSLADSRRQATTDELTGLGNRRLLHERLAEVLPATRREGSSATLLLADLDGFKELNDTLGHQAGDLLLKLLGPRVLAGLSERDTLVRLGGDEFAVLLPDMDPTQAIEVVRRLQEILEQGFTVNGITIHVEASFGIASFPAHASGADELIQHSDVAMYQAKRARTGFEIYAPDRDGHSRDRLRLMGELREAIENDELVLHYQPKCDLSTGSVTGVEALVRWQHPQRGLLPPVEFLPIVEHTSLMRPLTLYVLDEALRENREWRDQGIDLSVAVNLSVPNLLDQRLPDDVAWLLGKHRVAPRSLKLEVTENIITADPTRVTEVLTSLKRLGVGISLDDFGAGSSSLAFLKRLPVDELKIDRSFVMGMEQSHADAVIVRTTTELARRLGLRVVAEGVESAKSWHHLAAFGCEEAQGFFLQRPIPAADLLDWLADRDVGLDSPVPPAASLREAAAGASLGTLAAHS